MTGFKLENEVSTRARRGWLVERSVTEEGGGDHELISWLSL